jgi:VanZ family protein
VVDRVLRAGALGWAVGVVVLSLLPDEPGGPVAWDKARHALGYAVLTALVLAAFVWRPGAGARPARPSVPGNGTVLAGVVALGVVVELLQSQVGRIASAADAVANAVGALAAAALWAAVRHVVEARRERLVSGAPATH